MISEHDNLIESNPKKCAGTNNDPTNALLNDAHEGRIDVAFIMDFESR
jgi:hypothetical protein